MSRIPALDGLRGYAILGVVAVHLLGASGVLGRVEGTGLGMVIWGALGSTLDAFFVISAFVLFLPAVQRGGDIGGAVSFWIKRAARLLPAFWLALAASFVLVAAWPPTDGFPGPSLSEVASHLTLLQMPAHFVDFDLRVGFGINGPLWLVSVVVTFYALLPLIARSFYRYPLAGLGIAAVITIGWKLILADAPQLLAPFTNVPEGFIQLFGIDQFPSWAFSFALGMAAAWAYHHLRERWSSRQLARAATIAIGPLLAVILVLAYIRGHDVLTTTGYISQNARMLPFETALDSATRTALILTIVIGPAWLARPFANRITSRLAELSYGVYLFHFILIAYAGDKFGLPADGTVADLVLWTIVVLPASLLIAAISRRYLELPAAAWVRRWSRARYGPAPSKPPEPETAIAEPEATLQRG